MLLYFLLSVVSCLEIAMAKDVFTRAFKTIPSVSHSLINFGKMDIAFHFNAKPQDFKPDINELDSPSRICPCSGFNSFQESSPKHPFELIDKILSSNNLFNFKEHSSSALCCDSHEQVNEDILFEFSPRRSQMVVNPLNSNFMLPPNIFNPILKATPQIVKPTKNRAIEIFLFPKRKDVISKTAKNLGSEKKDVKSIVKVVGDGPLKNEIKTGNFIPPLSSVPFIKSDLIEEKLKQETKISEEPNDIVKGNSI